MKTNLGRIKKVAWILNLKAVKFTKMKTCIYLKLMEKKKQISVGTWDIFQGCFWSINKQIQKKLKFKIRTTIVFGKNIMTAIISLVTSQEQKTGKKEY